MFNSYDAMRKPNINSIILLIGLTVTSVVTGQSFVNLDFEQANVSGYSPGDSIPASDAIPGWTAYFGGVALTDIDYDVPYHGVVNINDQSAFQGTYDIAIEGAPSEPASIGQTGTIPATAQFLIFSGLAVGRNGDYGVSFNGQMLSFSVLAGEGTYFIYEADISAFSGQTGQLLFTSTLGAILGPTTIDNIQFSSTPIPEPSPSWLLLLGGGVFFYSRRIFQH
ncbi:MAG TPA: PEP-CTERM sorting domain-containing protein [Verrucomicrobiae bacterium]|nr:PEP-CTERM sorting domain-containing protein [Verrucomicrobiae bacterium]